MRRFIVIAGRRRRRRSPSSASWPGRRWFSTLGRCADRRRADAARATTSCPTSTMSDTRGITIDAPPSAVWPWLAPARLRAGRLVQLRRDGHEGPERRHDPAGAPGAGGRGHRARPTRTAGSRSRCSSRSGRSCSSSTTRSSPAARTRRGSAPASSPGLAASGRFMQASMPPEFAVSWAIVLQPLEGGRTRLIERVRAAYGATTRGDARVRADARLRRVPDDPAPDAGHRRASAAIRGRSAGLAGRVAGDDAR